MTLVLFVLVAIVVVISGRWVAYYGDVLAEKTGLGRSFIGLFLLAATTSLPETFNVASAALQDLPDIALGNLLGASMVNFLLLVLLDATHPHPIATRVSRHHVLSVGLVVILLSVAGLGLHLGQQSNLTLARLFAALLLPLYSVALWISFKWTQQNPTAQPDELPHEPAMTLSVAGARYAAGAVVLIVAAVFLPNLAERLAEESGLARAWVGTFLVGLITTLPEATVTLAAARLGAADLALGNALGSTMFNTLLITFADVLQPMPLFARVSAGHFASLTALLGMSGAVLAGLAYGSGQKIGKLSLEMWGIVLFYVVAFVLSIAQP